MATLGDLLKQQDPEKYGAMDAAQINANIAAHLNDPARRAAALATLRSKFSSVANLDDDTLTAKALKGVGVVSPTQAPPEPDPDAMRARNARATQMKMQTSYNDLRQKVRMNERAIDRGQPDSPAVDAQIQNFQTEIPTPRSTRHEVDPVDQQGPAGTVARYPVVDDLRELKRLADKEGLRLIMPGYGAGLQTVAVDRGNNIRYALNEQASRDPKLEQGGSAVGYFTGTSDPLQQGVAGAIADLTGIDKSSSLGPRVGTGLRSGYGLRELGGDVGERVAKAIPGNTGAKATAAVLEHAWYRPQAAIDRGEANLYEGAAGALQRAGKAVGSDWLQQTPVLDRLAAENRTTAREEAGRAEDLRNFRENVDALPQDEVATLGGRYAGYSAGEGAQLVAPTAAGLVGGQLAGAAAKAAAPYAGKAIAAAAKTPVVGAAVRGAQEAARGARHVLGTELGRATLDEHAAKFGVRDQAGRDVAEAMSVAGRTAGQRFEQNARDEMMAAAEPVFAAHGVTDAKEKGRYLNEVLSKWSRPSDRLSASPVAQEIMDDAQVRHFQLWQQGGLAEGGQRYNPYHPLWGQDPTKAARMTESAAARAQETMGKDAWEASPMITLQSQLNPQTGMIPGLRALGKAGAQAKEFDAAVMRPLPEIMGNIAERQRQARTGFAAMTSKELQRFADEAKTLTYPEAFARSARAVRGDQALANMAARDELLGALPDLMAHSPDRYTDFWDLQKKLAGGVGDLHAGRTARGTAREGDVRMSQAMEAHLRDNDLAVIRVEGQPQLPGGAWEKRAVTLPKEFGPELNGKVMDRYMAETARQIANPSKAKAFSKKVANVLDHAFGLTQAKAAITTGNPGFSFRVNTGDFMRHVISEGTPGIAPNLRKLVADVSNATPGSAVLSTMEKPGGGKYTLGELRDMLEKYGDVRRTFANDIGADERVAGGAGRLTEMVIGDKATSAYNKAVELTSLPGHASSKLADLAYRDMFRVGGTVLNPGYSAGEGIRMLNMLSQMQRGVAPSVAGAKARQLMVDFGNTTAAQDIIKPAVPFIKFWSQGLAGALEVAKRNPRGFFRLADIARYVEGGDQATRGGAMDPRTKDPMDVSAMRPRFETGGGRVASLRFENPQGDVVDIADAARSTGDPNERRGLGQFIGPSLGRAAALLTGRDIATGRSVLGADKEEAKRLSGTLPQQLYQAIQDGVLTKGQAAYLLAKWLPGAPPLTGPVDLGLRVGAHLGGATANPVSEDDVGALERALPGNLVGVRLRRTDPQRVGLDKASTAVREMPEPMRQANIKRRQTGKKEARP